MMKTLRCGGSIVVLALVAALPPQDARRPTAAEASPTRASGRRPGVVPPLPDSLRLPDGLSVVDVPAVVSEVEARVVAAPDTEALARRLRVADEPQPKMPPRDFERRHDGERGARPFHTTPDGWNGQPGAATEQSTAAVTTWDSLTSAITGSFPPDPIGAAGPSHVVNVVNVNYAFYDKSGTPAGTGLLSAFFSPLANGTPYDPKVVYDTIHDRFVIIALTFGGTPQSAILAAVSDDSDPTGTWYRTEIDAVASIGGANHFADYPSLAVDEEAVYVTANMFRIPVPQTYSNARLWVIRKGAGAGGLYDGGAASVTAVNAPTDVNGGFNFTLQPALLNAAHPDPDVGTYLTTNNGLNDGSRSFLQVYTLTDPLVNPPTFNRQFVALGSGIDNFAFAIPTAPQAEAVPTNIDAGDRRIYSSAWRDDQLLVATMVRPPSGPDAGEGTVHWVSMDTTLFNLPLVNDQGNVAGEDIAADTHTFYPSIAVNDSGTIGLGFAASGPAIYPGAYFTFRQPWDPPGTVQPSEVLRAGVDRYIRVFGGRNRWGDYSGIATDPVDGCFWVYNEYSLTEQPPPANQNNNGVWGTAWGKFCRECGNATVEPGETCDPPGAPAGQPDECRANCTYCGDGLRQLASGEQCDDGNLLPGDGCDLDCIVEICGNGIVQAGESCDPPGLNAGLPNECRFECTFCGDAVANGGGGELLLNGGFELGNFAGWGGGVSGNGLIAIDTPGTPTLLSAYPTAPNAGGGNFYAVADSLVGATQALAQGFTVPSDATSVTLSFEMFANNWNAGGTIVDPVGLDHTGPPNQHARVDLVNAGFGSFDTSGAAVVANYYIGADGISPPAFRYTPYNLVITGDVVPGQSYEIRFADTANQDYFTHGIDNVSIAVTRPPEGCDDGNNVGGDACTSVCQPCTTAPFAQTILALDPATFGWSSPVDVFWAVGDLAQVSTYATLATGAAAFATSVPVAATPAPGDGLYFVARIHCRGASWSSGGSGECNPSTACPLGGRDGNLP